MNDANEDLEAELAALRPHDATPGLRRRIANHRARSRSGSWFTDETHRVLYFWQSLANRFLTLLSSARWRRGLALASGLAAACAVVLLLRWGGGRDVGPEPNFALTRPEPQPAPSVAVVDTASTFVVYRRALVRSPEDLDALLAKHALVAQNSNPELVQISAFTRSDAAFHTLLGDD